MRQAVGLLLVLLVLVLVLHEAWERDTCGSGDLCVFRVVCPPVLVVSTQPDS